MSHDEFNVIKIPRSQLNGKTLDEYMRLYFGDPVTDPRFDNGDDAEETFFVEIEEDE